MSRTLDNEIVRKIRALRADIGALPTRISEATMDPRIARFYVWLAMVALVCAVIAWVVRQL